MLIDLVVVQEGNLYNMMLWLPRHMCSGLVSCFTSMNIAFELMRYMHDVMASCTCRLSISSDSSPNLYWLSISSALVRDLFSLK